MRKLILMLFLLLTGIFQAQEKKALGDFNTLRVFDKINVNLIPSTENKIEITGDNSKDVEVINKNSELKIRMKTEKTLSGEDVKVNLYFTNLKGIDANEGSVVSTSDVLKLDELKISVQEGAEVELNLDAKKVVSKSQTGGVVRLSGKADKLEAGLGTGGKLEAKTLRTVNTKVSINAGGEAQVNASDVVDAKVNAGGEVKVYGDPKTINKNITLGGSVEKSEQ